jgi:hypothetical protein
MFTDKETWDSGVKEIHDVPLHVLELDPMMPDIKKTSPAYSDVMRACLVNNVPLPFVYVDLDLFFLSSYDPLMDFVRSSVPTIGMTSERSVYQVCGSMNCGLIAFSVDVRKEFVRQWAAEITNFVNEDITQAGYAYSGYRCYGQKVWSAVHKSLSGVQLPSMWNPQISQVGLDSKGIHFHLPEWEKQRMLRACITYANATKDTIDSIIREAVLFEKPSNQILS